MESVVNKVPVSFRINRFLNESLLHYAESYQIYCSRYVCPFKKDILKFKSMSKMSKSIAVTWVYSSLWYNDFMRQYLRLNDEKLHFKDVFLPPYDLFSLPVISSCKGILHLFYDGHNGDTRTCWFLKRNTIKVIRIVIFMYAWNQYAHMHMGR